MTIETLLGMSADELEALTDKQRLEYFAPYLPVTRPDQAAASKMKDKKGKIDPAMQAMDMLKNFGIDFNKL